MAFPSPYMSLTVWNLGPDLFSHAQLAGDMTLIDAHDHSTGKGIQITAAGLAANSVTATQIAVGAVGAPELAAGAVTGTAIAAGTITSSQLAANSVTTTAIASGTIVQSDLDSHVLPLGFIALWFPPTGTSVPGGSWEICDGRAWSSFTNIMGAGGVQLNVGNMPDFRGKFGYGADINGSVAPAPGASGGSATANLAHSHNVNAHSHYVDAHVHSISSDGSHNHTFAGGFSFHIRANAFSAGIQIKDTSNNTLTANLDSTYVGPYQLLDTLVPMDVAGAHSHTGQTGPPVQNGHMDGFGGISTENTATATDSQLGNVSTLPPYVAAVMIMRVR